MKKGKMKNQLIIEKSITNLIDDLQKDVKIVAVARFNKVKRLERQSKLALIAISFLSFTLIVASLVSEFYKIDHLQVPFLNYELNIWFFSLLSSIFILVISVFISKNQYDLQISKLYASAVKINKLVRELEYLRCLCNTDEKKVRKKYTKILNEYNRILDGDHTNHDNIDYITAKKFKGFMARSRVSCLKVFYFLFQNISFYYV